MQISLNPYCCLGQLNSSSHAEPEVVGFSMVQSIKAG